LLLKENHRHCRWSKLIA